MEENRLLGYFRIKEGLHLKSECLGKNFEIHFNDFKAVLFTPSLPKDFSRNLDSRNHPLIQPLGPFHQDLDWGTAIGWPTGEANVISFRLELSLPDINSQEDRSILGRGIEEWLIRLRTNLFAYGYNIDSPTVILDNPNSEKIDFYLFSPFYGTGKHSISPSQLDLNIYVEPFLDLKTFEELLEITSAKKSLKLEFLLLKEAEHSLTLKNYRRSILDSATAFELSLTNALLNNLEIENEELLKRILRMNNSISKKRNLLKFTSFDLPGKDKDYATKLEALRNRAIHIGKTPTGEEASEAYKLAKEAVNYLTPEKFE